MLIFYLCDAEMHIALRTAKLLFASGADLIAIMKTVAKLCVLTTYTSVHQKTAKNVHAVSIHLTVKSASSLFAVHVYLFARSVTNYAALRMDAPVSVDAKPSV